MKVSFILFTVTALSLSASSYAQTHRITIDKNNVTIAKIFSDIEEQSEFSLLFSHREVDVNRRVSYKGDNVLITDILSAILSQDIAYRITDKHIILFKADASLAEPDFVLQGITITGTVTDDTGESLPGVNVVIKGANTGVITGADGRYSINVPGEDAVLVFSFVGYATQEFLVGEQRSINVTFSEMASELEEVVVVGYGTQRKATLTGSVASIKGEALITTKNENVQNMLTGKVLGVRVWQRSAEPGAFDNQFDIRGMGTPLIVIDGVPRTMAEFQRLAATDIDDISVLKDGSAAIYGVRAANGVVLVTTKRGTKNAKAEVNYSGSLTYQVPLGMLEVTNVFEYMELLNEQRQRSMAGPQTPIWDAEQFEAYRNGTKKSWDWEKYIIKKYSPETQHNLSVSGGNDRTNYYVGTGYFYQNSIFKTDDLNYHKYNLSSNISTKIFDNLTFDLQLSAIVDEKNEPNKSIIYDVIYYYWVQNPMEGPFLDDSETMYSADVLNASNPVAFLNADVNGWFKNQNKWFDGTASLKYDLPWVKGLNIKGLFGYNYNFNTNRRFRKEYVQYTSVGGDTPTPVTSQSPSQYTVSQFIRTQMLSQFVLNYDGLFERNRVGLTLVWESQWRDGDNFYAQRELVFPKPTLAAGIDVGQIGAMYSDQGSFYKRNNNALAGRLNYSFADKYLAEFVFRYDGSSIWAEDHQWGFFPGGSLAWRVSEEDFFKNSPLGFIQQLKLRASYASTGDDAAAQYQFMSGYNYPTNTDWFNPSYPWPAYRFFSAGYVFDGNFYNSVDNRGIPNRIITWYKAKTLNLGVDFEAWDGLFGFTFEYFNRERTGLLSKRSGDVPTVLGGLLPDENINSDRHFGLELMLTHRQKLGDFSYRTSLMTSVTRSKLLFREEQTWGNSWERYYNSAIDRMLGIYRGYGYQGQYQSWEDIWNSPVYNNRTTLPGDYIYEDWNGDGVIDGNDIHPIRYSNNAPLMNFSLNLGAAWKSFDLSLLLQGSALGSHQYGEQYRNVATMRHFADRWHTAESMADPYDTSTEWVKGYYALASTYLMLQNSEFNIESTAYLRLKNIELGYTLPEYKGFNLRLYVSGYNVFTFTKIRDVDPEHPGMEAYSGYMYPLSKTFTCGLTLKF